MGLYKILFSALYCSASAYINNYNNNYNNNFLEVPNSVEDKALNFVEDLANTFLEELWHTIQHEEGNVTVTCLEPLICVKYQDEHDWPKINSRLDIEYDFSGKNATKNIIRIDVSELHETVQQFQIDINHSGNYAQFGLAQNPLSMEDFEEHLIFSTKMSHNFTNDGIYDIKSKNSFSYNIDGKDESVKANFHMHTKDTHFKFKTINGYYGNYYKPLSGKTNLQISTSIDITDGLLKMFDLPKMDMSVDVSNKFYLNFEDMKFHLRVKGTAFGNKLSKIIFGLSLNEKRQAAVLHAVYDVYSSTMVAKIFQDGWARCFGWANDGFYSRTNPIHIFTWPVEYNAYNSIEDDFEKFLGVGPGQNKTIVAVLAEKIEDILYDYTKYLPDALLETAQLTLFADKWTADIESQKALDFSGVITGTKIDSGLLGSMLLGIGDGTKEGELNKYVSDFVKVYSAEVANQLSSGAACMGEARAWVLDVVGEKGKEEFNSFFE